MVFDISLCQDEIDEVLAAARPRSLLAIGPGSARAFAGYCQQHPDTRLVEANIEDLGEALATSPAFDLALVANTLEQLPRAQAGRLIAALRDLHARRLYVLVPIGSDWPDLVTHWSATELIAYGLKAAGEYALEGRALQFFRHDLYDYKDTPDWLNPKDWANPELWDKHRW